MRRTLLALVLLVLGLGAWERLLVRGAAAERTRRSRVGHLLDERERASFPRPLALRVEAAGEPAYAYAPIDGIWRCVDLFGAPADDEAIGRLLSALVQAEGSVRTEDPGRAADYGIGTPETLRVSLLEASSGEAFLSFDLGASVPGAEAGFVRRLGTPAVWAIDGDPRALFGTRAAPGSPPLLAPGILHGSWPGWRAGPRRVDLERADGSRLELVRRELAPDPERLRAGRPPWTWDVVEGGEPSPASEASVDAFLRFLARVPYDEVLDPGTRARDAVPFARVELSAPEAPPLRIELEAPLADGTLKAWVQHTGALYRLDPAVAAALLPGRAVLVGEGQEPWSALAR